MEKYIKDSSEKLKIFEEKGASIEQEANFEGYDALVLIERLKTPAIFKAIVDYWEMGHGAREASGNLETFTLENEDGSPKRNDSGELVLNKRPFYIPSRHEIEEEVSRRIEEIEKSTPVRFDDAMSTSCGIGIFWSPFPDKDLSLKQKIIIEAHEKGHVVRETQGGVEGEMASLALFDKYFDFDQVEYSQEQYEKDKELFFTQETEDAIEETGNTEEHSYESFKEKRARGLNQPMEFIERMSQLKNYFGFKDERIFTQEHLNHSRENYIKDTGLDNGISIMFQAIRSDELFLELINTIGI